MSNIIKIILLIAMLIIAICYFQLYHSMFRVIYFRNMLLEMIFEFIGCFILAMLTMGAILKVFKFLFGIVGVVLAFILKVIIALLILGGIVYVICLGIKAYKKFRS